MPPTFRNIWVTDYAADEETVAAAWKDAAPAYCKACEMSITDAQSALAPDDLVLVFGTQLRAPAVNAILARAATAVLHLGRDGSRRAHEAGGLLAKNSNLVDVVGSTNGHLDRFKNRLDSLYSGKEIYPPIDALHELRGRRQVRVFPSTSFQDAIGTPFLAAVEAAFRKPRFENLNPGDRHVHGFVPQTVRDGIKKSNVLIANMRETKGGRTRSNVWYELGFVDAIKGKKTIIFRHVDDSLDLLPSDIAGRIWGEYEDELDLTMQLWFGMPECFRR